MSLNKEEKKWSPTTVWKIGAAIAVCALLLSVTGCATSTGTEPSSSVGESYADIVIADYGTITISLDSEAAPETVDNFISLAESGFYDGLTFHRIIEPYCPIIFIQPAMWNSYDFIETPHGAYSSCGRFA